MEKTPRNNKPESNKQLPTKEKEKMRTKNLKHIEHKQR